jgi:hypothetical protein
MLRRRGTGWGYMNVWREFTKRREGIDRFVVNGLSFALVGIGMGALSFIIDDSFFMRSLAGSFVVIGLSTAGVAAIVIAHRKRDGADR